MADIKHITANGDTYDIADAVARENADSAMSTATDAAITASSGLNLANQVKSQVNNLTFTINSDDLGIDVTVD